jgi:hypothetical protein
MLRLARRLIPPMIAMLCIAAAVLWGRSYGRDVDMLIGAGPTARLNAAASYQGRLVLFVSDVPFDPAEQWSLQPVRAPAEEVEPLYGQLFEPGTTLRVALGGFQIGHGTINVFKTPPAFTAFAVPHWFVVMVTGFVTVVWIRNGIRRWWRARRGQCRACGYDLRSSPDRCPECGEEPRSRRRPANAAVAAMMVFVAITCAQTARAGDWRDVDAAELDFSNATLGEALDRIGTLSGRNFVVRWPSLEAAGIARDTRIRLHLWDVRLTQAMDILFGLVGGGTVELGCEEIDGILTVSTAEDLQRDTPTRVYDVRDLLVAMHRTDIPGIPDDEQPIWPEMVDELTRLITEIVEPDSWRDAGGSLGSIRELGGRLIVTQSATNQKKLQEFFAKLREEFAKPLPTIQPVPATAPANGKPLFGKVCVYDVRDLLAASAAIDAEWNSDPRTPYDLEDQLVDAIIDNVEPYSWEGRPNRSAVGSTGNGINVIGGRLVVRQSPEGHEMLKRFLAELRKELLPGVKLPATSPSAPIRRARPRVEGLFGSARG